MGHSNGTKSQEVGWQVGAPQHEGYTAQKEVGVQVKANPEFRKRAYRV